MTGPDRVYWHEGERAARVPESCVRAIVRTAGTADKVQPASCVAVFTALALHANGDGDGARPKVDTIAELLALSGAQVRRIITSVLIPAGVVSKRPNVHAGRKVGNIYTLTRPEAHIPIATQGALPTAPDATPQPQPQARTREQTSEQTTEQTNPAHGVALRVVERKRPKPAQSFVAIMAVARALLGADWSAEQVERAMLEAPTISTRACEVARSRWPGEGRGSVQAGNVDQDRQAASGQVQL